jgi:hypothetical protein
VVSKLGKVLVVFTLVAALSAHWALLQTVAWTTMLAGNLESCSFHVALTRTFDGQHPCPLCKAIAAAKNSEQKNQVSFEQQRLDFTPVEGNPVLIAPSRVEIHSQNSFAESILPEPLTPPPRGSII